MGQGDPGSVLSEPHHLLSQVRPRIGTRATETTGTRDTAGKATVDMVGMAATATTTTPLVTMDTAPDMTTVGGNSQSD